MTQDAYTLTCLHEASHAITALALGIHVSRLAVDSADGATAGEAFLALPDDSVHAVAILLAGTNGVNAFSHLLGDVPCNALKNHHAEATRHGTCIHPPESSRVSPETWQSSPESLGTDRDGGMIVNVLSALPDASDIFNRADMLSRRILAENCRVLMILTRRLATDGELTSDDFQDVLRAIIPACVGAIWHH